MTPPPPIQNAHLGRKVLLVGNVFGRELGNEYYMVMPKLLHGFIRLGCNLHVFNDRVVARGSTPLLSTATGSAAANRKLIETCRNFRPELMLLGHADLIGNETLATVRAETPGLRIGYRNVDALTDPANRDRVKRRAQAVDAIFVTSAAPVHGLGADSRAPVYFMPNPVDPAIDIGRSFARSDQDYDLFFSAGNANDTRVRFIQQAAQRVPDLRADLRGVGGRAPVRGAAYLEAMANARMGISISRPDNIYLYASDRMSQLLGNGLLTFVSRTTGFQDLFSDDEIAFYEGLEELVDKLSFFVRNDRKRQEVAEAGWRAAHSMFASHRVAKYILERCFAETLSETYPWPTASSIPAAPPQQQRSSAAR